MQQKTPDSRVNSMFRMDCIWAYGAVLVLWAVYSFVFYQIMPFLNDQTVFTVLAISGGLVLLFNSASILAMTSHYSEDREHIYGLDIHYLDIMNRGKR